MKHLYQKSHVHYIQFDGMKHTHVHYGFLLNLIICYCRLRVTKEGPNKDREFYSCSLPRGQGCDFFQWADVTGIV